MNPTYYALIPAFEPDSRLPELVEDAVAAGFHVIVVNDGSGSDCHPYFNQAEYFAAVLHHPENLGKGAALKTGFEYIKNICEPDDIIVTLDADGQHTISDALEVCNEARLHPDSLILGSRELSEHVPLRSQFGNTVTRWVYRLASSVCVHDTQTGLRSFTCSLLPKFAAIPGNRYEYEMNVLLTCPKEHISIREVPIKTIYLDNNKSSHFHTIKDSFRIYKEILKFSASSLVCFLIDYLLFSVLSFITGGIATEASLILSNVIARITSATINYSINRSFVFHADTADRSPEQKRKAIQRSALQYTLLAGCILLGNTLVLSFLAEVLGMNRLLAKLITELFFFLFSYTIQRRIIFRSAAKNTTLSGV